MSNMKTLIVVPASEVHEGEPFEPFSRESVARACVASPTYVADLHVVANWSQPMAWAVVNRSDPAIDINEARHMAQGLLDYTVGLAQSSFIEHVEIGDVRRLARVVLALEQALREVTNLDERDAEVMRANQQVQNAEREADRLRHGTAIEGDFVCSAELWRTTVEPLIEALRRTHPLMGTIAGAAMREAAIDALLAATLEGTL